MRNEKDTERSISMPVGVVIRRTPGVTRWARHAWKAVAVLPGAAPADWTELRRDGEAVEYHAGTLDVVLYRTDTEAYRVSLSTEPPTIYVILRPSEDPASPHDLDLVAVTVSAFEAQDHTDNGEDIVEPVPMPEGLAAWVRTFVERHHVDDVFVKRRRDKLRTDLKEDGRGDPRIRQETDVYRAPRAQKPRLH